MKEKEAYLKKLEIIIKRSFAVAGRRPLSSEALRDMADNWHYLLAHKIPAEYLDKAELKANELKRDSNPLHPSELGYAFEVLKKDLPEIGINGKECSFKRWHLDGYNRPHIQSSNFRTNEKIVIPCPTCRDKFETGTTEDFFTEMKLFKIAQVFHFAQTLKIWLITLIDIEGNPITSAIESGNILRDMSPLGQVREKWKERFEDFKATDFNDRQTQKEISAELKNLRKQELDLIKLEK